MARKDQKQFYTPNAQEEQLLNNPIFGEKLKQGGSVAGADIPLDIRRQLGIDTNQQVRLDPTFLKGYAKQQADFALQDQANPVSRVTGQGVIPNVDRVSPIKNIKDALTPNMINPQGRAYNPHTIAPSTAPTKEIPETASALAGLNDIVTQLVNILAGQASQGNLNSGFVGLGSQITNPAPDAGIVPVTGDLAGGQAQRQVDPLGRLFTSEGRAVTMQELLSLVRDVLPKSSITADESSVLPAASRAFPELAGRTDKKGLEKFSGAGEFKVNGNKYKIVGSKIVKVG